MAQVAWSRGYLHGIGKPNIERAFARQRSLENIRYRRVALAAQKLVRALDRIRRQIFQDNARRPYT